MPTAWLSALPNLITALSVLSGHVGLALESAVAGEVCFESVREKVRLELDMYVDLPGFIDLFEFVINMGATKSPFIPQLLEFGSKFVDNQQRQLSLQAFAEVNKVGLEFPRVKIAMLMRAYRKPPSRTWCPLPETYWTSGTKEHSLYKLEAVLRYFQCTCKPAVAGMQSLKLATLTANVAVAAADAFIMCKEREKEGDAMMSAVAKHLDEINVFAASMARDPPPEARAGLDGFRRNEAEEQRQGRNRGHRAQENPAKGDHVRPRHRPPNQRAGQKGCNRSGG